LRLWDKEVITSAKFHEDVFYAALTALMMAAGILLFGRYNRFFRS
jgi:hypothetical protein